MIITKPALESKVDNLNSWLQHHPETHYLYRQQTQKRDYYVNKLCDMDDLGLKTIKI
ncbi:hypothetical protein [Tenacibaculum aestuarii]|uniref:hypothetical protein n=1 Tax=Tenacibaculum aestuarii TaxID=362781 RepID=UPI0038B512B4